MIEFILKSQTMTVNQDPLSFNYKNSKTHSVEHSFQSERLSVDEGIIDKLQKRRQRSINLTVDMSTGHLNIDYETDDDDVTNIDHADYGDVINMTEMTETKEIEYEKSKSKRKKYRKRRHKSTVDIGGENVDLEPNEFIVGADSDEYDSDDIERNQRSQKRMVSVLIYYENKEELDDDEHSDDDILDDIDNIHITVGGGGDISKPTTDPSADPSLISDEYIEGMNGSFDEIPSSKTTTDPTRDPTADQTVIIVVINE